MKHLDVKRDNKKLFIPDEPIKVYDLLFDNNHGNRIIIGRNSWESMCINCHRPRCIYFEPDEIMCNKFELSQYHNESVCPLGAISEGRESVIVDNDKCIGCGICASRCPFGAISVRDQKAIVSVSDNRNITSYPDTNENAEKQQRWINNSKLNSRAGCICDDEFLKTLLIAKDEDDGIIIKDNLQNQIIQRNLILSLLIQLGYSVQLPRIGITSERMDCVFQNGESVGVVEIETGEDTLDVPRNLLDDVAMIQYRFNITKDKIIPLHICFKLQNRRSEYWRIVNDIEKISKIKINTITIGALFLIMWNFISLEDIRQFYFDSEVVKKNQTTIRSIIEKMLDRPLLIDKDTSVFFENEK